MQDEYGKLTSNGQTWVCPELPLENGQSLYHVPVRYNTYGTLNSTRTNVFLVLHALTGNAELTSWWGGMLGPGLAFDTDKYFVVCANSLGSCYGTCGPSSINPATGRKYGSAFPQITVRDSVELFMRLLDDGLHVQGLDVVCGGSMGGMQALEVALHSNLKLKPKRVVVIGAGGRHTAWQIGFNEVQRQAIFSDPKWRDGDFPEDDPPRQGLSLARQIAMLSYRSHPSYCARYHRSAPSVATLITSPPSSSSTLSFSFSSSFSSATIATTPTTKTVPILPPPREGSDDSLNNNQMMMSMSPEERSSCSLEEAIRSPPLKSQQPQQQQHRRRRASDADTTFDVIDYLHAQGERLIERNFDAATYVCLANMLDTHDVSRGRGEYPDVLRAIVQPSLIVSIASDVLYPKEEQIELLQYLPNASLFMLPSLEGHDGFFLAQKELGAAVQQFLTTINPQAVMSRESA